MMIKFFSLLVTLVNVLVWNGLIYFTIETYRGHSNFSWLYLGVAAVGCLAVSKLKTIVDAHLPTEEPNEGA